MDGGSAPSSRLARRRELYYVGYAVLFLAVGIGAVWLVHSVLDVEGDAILVAILVLPVVLYLILGGRVDEIVAGGLTVKLAEARGEPISQAATGYVPTHVAPGSDPHGATMKTNPNAPQVVTLRHGGDYTRLQVLNHLKMLSEVSPVPFLIVVDDHGRVLAYMTYRSALDVLEREERGDMFIEVLRGGDPDAFDDGGGFTAVRTETLSANATNAEALETMEDTGLDVLLVVDRKGRFEGIVERGDVLSRMMLALVGRPTPI